MTMGGVRVYFRTGGITTDIPVNQIQHLQWSPSGEFLLAETVENIWWIYQHMGNEMLLKSVIPTSRGVTWLTDYVLLFAPSDGGLLSMNLSENNVQATLLDNSQVYVLPYQIGDGVYRVFKQNPDSNLGRLMLVQIDANGNAVTEDIGEGDVELSSVRWAPGGNLLIAFQGGVMALVDPVSGMGFTLPVTSAVGYDWGTPKSNMVDLILTEGELYFLGQDIMGSPSGVDICR